MKQAVKKTEATKPSPNQVNTSVKAKKVTKTEKARLEANLFSRFLEASCDCV